jgi:hypothetical protein
MAGITGRFCIKAMTKWQMNNPSAIKPATEHAPTGVSSMPRGSLLQLLLTDAATDI